MEFTARRRCICSFITEFATHHGFPPTLREIGAAVGIASTSAVTYQILALERLGAIRREPRVSRSITVSPEFRKRAMRRSRTGEPMRSGESRYAQ